MPEDVDELLRRANQGDETTLPAVRKLLDEQSVFVRVMGDLAARSQNALADRAAGGDLAVREAIRRQLHALRSWLLAGPAPPPVERLLVERVLTGWLHLHSLELSYARADGLSLEVAAYYDRSLDRAQRRYLSAIKALAVVRRLALPILLAQVNVAANQQVNVGARVKSGQETATAGQGGAKDKELLPDVRPMPSGGR
jgi:hypothetical protein